MIDNDFVLNEQTLKTIEQIGEHMPGGFFIYHADGDEELIYANKAVFDIFGCRDIDEFRELTGYTFKGMLHPDDYEAISSSIIAQIEGSEDNKDYVEYRIIRKDGEVRWIDDYGHFVKSDDMGGIYYVFISDITEKRLQMEKDRVVRAAVTDALARAYNTVWLINDVDEDSFSLFRGDTDGGTAHFEPISRALSQLKYSQAKAQYIDTMAAEEDRPRLHRMLELSNIMRKTADGSIYAVGYRRLFGNEVRYYRVEFARCNMQNGKTAIVAGFKDVDKEVRKEKNIQQALRDATKAANESNRAKSDFLSSMSHDIRTPMNGIIGMTAIAQNHINDPKRVADCLDKITEASGHLLSLINEVLDMNKIESGKVELTEEEFNISEAIDNLLIITRPQIAEHGHELRLNISDVEHENVIGDRLRLQQIFINLMSNAIKYTPNGGIITLSISEHPTKKHDLGCYEFIFEDNGIGMTEEFQKKLFEPFARANDEKTSFVQGTGLGMAITRNIVRMMGGDIQVESVYGKGTRFTVVIYLRLHSAEEIDHELLRGRRVLVVDDDAISCASVCGILSDVGAGNIGVHSGQEAIDAVRECKSRGERFDAVIIDWKMPGMDGLETTYKLRELIDSDSMIVICSAYDWADIEQAARTAGANAFISKPIFKTNLIRLIRSVNDKEVKKPAPLSNIKDIDLRGRRALLAEDVPMNAEIVMHVLKVTGLETEWVINGEAAVKAVANAPDGYYDVIFMDIQMPRLNGYQAAKSIRAMDREYAKKVPIIAMTANAFSEDVRRAKHEGMNDHISKPIDFAELARVLEQWVKQKNQP